MEEGDLSTSCEPDTKTPQKEESDCSQQRQEQCKVQVAEQKDVISNMPVLVQDKIFGYLGTMDKVTAARVCSSWKQAVYQPRHWRHLQAKVNLDRMSEEDMDSLKERQICKVKVVHWSGKTNIASFFSEFKCLKSLHVCRFNGYMLFQTVAGARFVSLRELSFHTKDCKQELALKCSLVSFPNLAILEVEGIVTNKFLEACGDKLKNLKKLTLKSSDEVQELNLEAVSLMGNLQHLSLDGFRLENIHVLSNLSKPLKGLSVIYCQLSKEQWTDVLCRMTSLEELQFLSCNPGLDSDGLKLLAENLKNLKKLRFWYGEEPLFTNEDLMSVSQMSSLRDVQLPGTVNVTAEGFLAVCMNLRNLTAVELQSCPGMTTAVMEEIAKMPSLTELTLTECNDSKKLVEILRQSPLKLRKLHLHSCRGFEAGVEDIAQMSSLSHLALSHMPLGPDGMSILNKATFSLQTLSLVDCGATVNGLLPLLKKQQLLQELIMKEKSDPGTWLVPYLQSILPCIEECQVEKYQEL